MGRSGVPYALAAYGLWGLAPLYWKPLAFLPASEVVAHRVLWALLALLLLVAVLGRRRELTAILRSRRQLPVLVGSALLIGTNWGLYIWAVNHERILEASLGYYINPLVNVALGVAVLRERLRPLQLLAVALAAVGVAQLTWAAGVLPWISLTLAGTFGVYGLVRKIAPAAPLPGLVVELALLAPLAALYLGSLERSGRGVLADGDLTTTLLLAGTGIFTLTPLLCFHAAARRLRYATLGLFQYIAPSGNFLLAVVLYGEAFTRAHAITFACIWTACALYSLDTWRSLGPPAADG